MAHSATRQVFRRDQSTSNSASSSSSSSSAFFISDTSPLFSYGSSSGASSSSPWTAGYAQQSDGYDETLHLTSSSNSIISFNITALSLTLLVPAFDNCQATISINSSSPITACSKAVSSSSSEVIPFTLYNLPLGAHNVVWDSGTVPNGQQVIFWGIDGVRPPEAAGHSNVTIDDAFNPIENVNVGIRYEGDWTHLNPNAHSDALSESSKLDGDFNKTLAITQGKGSAVTFFGSGSSVYVYGKVGPDYGSASISLNGQVVAPSLNLTSPWQMPYELLWFQTGLDSSQANQVTMTNLGTKKMAVDFVVLTTDSTTLDQLVVGEADFLSSLKGKIILGIAIPLTIIILLSLLTIWIFRKRRSTRIRRNSRESTHTLRPSTNGNGSPNHPGEKPAGTASSRSVASFDDVFVSYDEALQQRLSERWRSPISPSNTNSTGTGRTPRSPETALGTNTSGLASVPENMISSPERVRSLLGSQYAATNPPDSRRGTALPAYTPEGSYVTQFTPVTTGNDSTRGHSPITAYETLTGTTMTPTSNDNIGAETLTNANTTPATNTSTSTPPQRFPTASEEKAAQLALFKTFENDINSSSSSPPQPNTFGPGPGPSGVAHSPERDNNNRISNTPSDILSIFGTAPGSEGRLSTLTDWTATTPNHQSTFLPRPGSELDNYPLPLPIINSTPPLKITASPGSNRIPLPSTSNPPVRPKVDMTFLNSPNNNNAARNQGSGSGSKHPFLISPAQIHTNTKSSSSNLPSSSYTNIPITPRQTSTTGNGSASDYSQSTGTTQKHRRNQSTASAWTERSAARPDSDIIPFENLLSGLQRAPTRD
ncbi:hypothetical protein V865_004908 [Kwoniella europaea PYCC6329]|uniref:Uncharacterized protein n=1 Tax=Kwoniella europaea PYCC6329 TaxID=1423913 RepID=A0AAX4KM18_9TREE